MSSPSRGWDEAPSDLPQSTSQPWPHHTPALQATVERQYFENGASIRFDQLPSHPSRGDFWIVISTLHLGASSGRRLRASEVDILSEHAARATTVQNWTMPVAAALGAWMSWRTRGTFKFWGYRPKTKIDPKVFPAKSMPLLRGSSATMMWHTLRFASYASAVSIPVILVGGFLREKRFRENVLADSRLHELRQDMKQHLQEWKKKGQVLDRRSYGQILEHPSELLARLAETQDRARAPRDHLAWQAPQLPPSASTDIKEKAGNGWGETSAETGSGWPSEQPSEQPKWTRTPSRPPPPPSRSQRSASQNEVDDSDLLEDDDASSIAPSAKRAESRQPQTSVGGSSWDRIRQQARAPAWDKGDSSGQEAGWARLRQDNPNPSSPSSERAGKTDSFAYSKKDEDREQRNYEKEKAQKEFDSLLDAERRGDSTGRS
ncbi:hypothetical protein GGR56DRAFT_417509 [Xylariaceae sp. FL0804]|nr:hypothetical protein GGR56DRAFT_417509 [Xylariaceae sp. FL0804]